MALEKEINLLKKIPLFAKLEPHRLKLLAFTCQCVSYKPGQTLFYKDEKADGVYIIVEGSVDILAFDGCKDKGITRGQNSIIGEMGVLTESPRAATVIAKTDVSALKLSSDIFLKLLYECPISALAVVKELSHKLVEMQKEVNRMHAINR